MTRAHAALRSAPGRRIRGLLLLACAASGGVVLSARAAEPASVASAPLEALVRQLGSPSYVEREQAAEALRECGLPTKAALFAGMESRDAEIALRCRRLWDQVRIDAGWRVVRETLGDSPTTRELYDRMFLAAPETWYALAESSADAEVALAAPRAAFEASRARLLELQQERTLDNWAGALGNALFFGARAKEADPHRTLPSLDDLLSTARSQQALAENEALPRLAARAEVVSPFERLLAALRGNSPQAAGLARELLRDPEAPAKQRQYALLALAKSELPGDQALLDAALDDATSLDALFTKGVVVESQLRDVALAVSILRRGRDPAEFGFRHLRPDDATLYSPASLGFRDAAERAAAFAQWSAFTSR